MAILERLKEMQNATGKNRLVMILDGMGIAVMQKLLDNNGFFYRHLIDTENSIIPATTVAATTAYQTGKMPWETGFIGWAQYFSETDEVIEIFRNTNLYTGEISKMPQHTRILPCKTVVEEMNDKGLCAFEIMPGFISGGCDTFEEWLDKIVETCNTETDAYIYAYWTEPDATLHDCGSKDPAVKALLRDMESKVEDALKKIHNKTVVLITADHGHTDVEHLFIEDYPDIAECLLHPISLEARCASFFIKSKHAEHFQNLFSKHFGKYFKLVTKDDFEKEYLHAKKHIRFIGDFVALATDKYELKQNHDCKLLKSSHAGITDEETKIPIIKISI